MRKGLFFLFVLIFVITGCESRIEVKKNFTSGIYVSTEDISFKGDFKRNSKGDLYLKVTYPENLVGFTYFVKDKKVKTEYMGIEDRLSLDDFPRKATIKVLYNVFESLEEENMRKEDKNYIMNADDYVVSVNEKGYIENIKGDDTEITFVGQS